MVTPQTQLTTVTDSGVLEANVAIPVERSHAISSTTTIEIVDDANQTIGTGTVSFVSPQVAADTQTVLVKADIDNAKGTLRADQVVRARVVWATRPGLAVPALAVTRTGGQAFVFVAESENQRVVARQRPVQLGDLIDNRYVVTSGLKPGERLITSNIQKVRNGAPVQIKG
jgi:RND family efflux transporter MFP subunit